MAMIEPALLDFWYKIKKSEDQLTIKYIKINCI